MSNEEHSAGPPVQLHVAHSLGGGSEKWLRDFGRADAARTNLVLRSFSYGRHAGCGLALYRDVGDAAPRRLWKFRQTIPALAISHPEYLATLRDVLREHRVQAILVSSLIGHSLDVLDSGLPTAVVCHDYFPYCPAINLYFDGVCASCDAERLARCHGANAEHNPFVDFPPTLRLQARERFLKQVLQPGVRVVTPSRSVRHNLTRLNPTFENASISTIIPGYGDPLAPLATAPIRGERMRIVVLGQLSTAKGVRLLEAAFGDLTQFAEIYLLGCGDLGELFRNEPHVHVHSHYQVAELGEHMARISPHVGLLASIVSETFSYTLSELMMLGVPPVATRVGSFADRIEHGTNGFLFDPTAPALIALLRALDVDRDALERVRGNLRGWHPRTPEEMVADYQELLPIAPAPPAGPSLQSTSAAPFAPSPEILALVEMWRENKQLHVRLSALEEARLNEGKRHEADELRLEREERRREEVAKQLAETSEELAREKALVREANARLEQVGGLLHARNMQLEEVYASTSWRVTGPLRWIGRRVRQLRILARCLRAAARDPASLGSNVRNLGRAWRDAGLLGLKKALLALQPNEDLCRSWADYRRRFETEVRPRMAEAIARMSPRPRISVIVPTYNTPERMLREMLTSVEAQLYPEWQLCLADDGSTQPHVRRILEEHAARDARIRVHLGLDNRGVSHASNQALKLATGDFIVLLDHDDILEEQALYRVAQSVAREQPDVLYSDEILMDPDGRSPRQLVYRAAFSPEYLRRHPYIVHLVGFAPALLHQLGGFDESLRISQDYDLVLRATEKARTVVHVPEILYRWRVHTASAGHRKMDEVMETSRAILARHLVRTGQAGRVEPGLGFNLFDPRYPLDSGVRVAIIIPTKNHVELVRRCVVTIGSTTRCPYEIVVVDHESDDPATLKYLAGLAGRARVLRYVGPFNFSAINNWAVAQLEPEFTHVLFCNNDVEATEQGWLERMLELGQQPDVGIVGAELFYGDRKTIQHAGVCVGAFERAEHYAKFVRLPDDRLEPGYLGALAVTHEVAAVTAACMLVRLDAFGEVGGFDEAIAVGFGDVDLCLRIGAHGYRVLFCPDAKLVHHESMTRGVSAVDTHPKDTQLFRLKWRELLEAGDPYYNPGLSLTSTTWSYRLPMPSAFEIRRRIASRDKANGRWLLSFSPRTDPDALRERKE